MQEDPSAELGDGMARRRVFAQGEMTFATHSIFGGKIFVPRQQLLVHHPGYERQQAHPIHSSSTPAHSQLIALNLKIVASATRRSYAGSGQLTVFSPVSILWPYGIEVYVVDPASIALSSKHAASEDRFPLTANSSLDNRRIDPARASTTPDHYIAKPRFGACSVIVRALRLTKPASS
jgi:hypothetical protein